MKIYVAGKWEDRLHIRVLQEALREMGHTITIDWTWHEKDDTGFPSQYAVEDIIGASVCDIYIGVFKTRHFYRGALVEMGAALASGKRVYILGHAIDSCIFVGHPLVKQFDTTKDLLSELQL